jgi:serine/threonine protein kinase
VLVADRYRLDAAIGRGGMGEVWRASDEVLGRPVAVKLLIGNETDEQAAARFRLEAQTAARLNHPHVVAVFDFGSWDDRFYLVMELVEGNSLAQELAAGGTFSPRRVAAIAGQAAAGLAAAHRQGVIHRDIKPGNLMLNADGTVKLGDFGIARFVDDASAALTSAGQIVGTSLYLAPERALGQPAGPGSDVYSLGCVLYQLLLGRAPFQADTSTAVLYMHVDSPPVPPSRLRPELPGALEDYLLRMLAKRPEDRPTAQEVADWFGSTAWRGEAERITTSGRHHGTRGSRTTGLDDIHVRVRAHMRRHKMLTGLVAGAGAFTFAALIGMAWFAPTGSGAEGPGTQPTQSADPDPTAPSFPDITPVEESPASAPATEAVPQPPEPKDGEEEREKAREKKEEEREKKREEERKRAEEQHKEREEDD